MPAYENASDAPTELGQLLLKVVPENEHGRKTFNHLAKELGISRTAIQKWIAQDYVPISRVDRLVEIGKIGEPDGGESRVSREDFAFYIYNIPKG
jgi:response regulator of citrate/malate metabolism